MIPGRGRPLQALIVSSPSPSQSWRKCFNNNYGTTDGNFVDHLIVRVRGGRGGDGGVSFFRGARISRGRPTGGDGGRGGHVIIVPDISLDSLGHIGRFFRAPNGGRGGPNSKQGMNGADLTINVPLGTKVRELSSVQDDHDVEDHGNEGDTSIEEEDVMFLNSEFDKVAEKYKEQGDFLDNRVSNDRKYEIEPDEIKKLSPITFDTMIDLPKIVARGGRGGRGNLHFGNNNHECERGQIGEERHLEFHLHTIADVGLVGLPNAGKSSFLTAVSNAHPKIASYPFTTLNPYIGVIKFTDEQGSITVADIPGLIEGAHQDRGLGHKFLKHVERAKVLAFVIDFAKNHPWKDLKVLINELELYKEGLSRKFRLVIANKADLLNECELIERINSCRDWLIENNLGHVEILPISAKYHLAITKVTLRLRHMACAQTI